MLPAWPLVAIELWITPIISAQASYVFPQGFTRFRWPSSAVDANTLYIDGGEVTAVDSSGDVVTTPLGCTIYLDLEQPWTNATVNLQYIDKPTNFPFARFPAIWYNQYPNVVQSQGGYFYGYGSVLNGKSEVVETDISDDDFKKVWALSQESKSGKTSWGWYDPQPSSHVNTLLGVVSVGTQDAFYALGGYQDTGNNAEEIAESGITIYDFKTEQWANLSSFGYGSQGYGAFGQAVATPVFGDSGVIVFLGGYTPPQTFSWDYEGSALQNLSQIIVYDLSTAAYITQQATGDIPSERWKFCAVGVSEDGTNTLDIFLHGGFATTQTEEPYDESLATVYVLSLPAFIWTKIPGSLASMRAMPTCQTIGQRQMVVVGGDDPTLEAFGSTPDPWEKAIGVFDMSAWQWSDRYDPSAPPYQRAPLLVEQSKNTPYAKTWSPGAAAIFVRKTGLSKGSGGGGNNKGNSNTGAIVGGAVGGVAVLALVVALIWFILRKRKQRQRQHQTDEVVYTKPELPSDTPIRSRNDKPDLPRAQPLQELSDHQAWEIDSPERYELQGDLGGHEMGTG